MTEVGETQVNDVEPSSVEASAVRDGVVGGATDVSHHRPVKNPGGAPKTPVAKKPQKVTKYLHLSIDDLVVVQLL